MDQVNDFYITLPSNVKSPKDLENTVANYTTKLPQKIKLQGKWEVGLVEISYTLSWYNINRGVNIKLCTFFNGLIKYFGGRTLKPGRYEDISSLIKEIKNIIKKYNISKGKSELITLPSMVYNNHSRKLQIIQGTFLNKIMFLCIDKYLLEKLGFNYEIYHNSVLDKMKEYNDIYYKSGSWSEKDVAPPPHKNELVYTSKRPIELNAGCQSLFVYSNVVKPTIVGNLFTPILRLVEVPTEAKFGDQIVIPYASPHYKPVSVNEFELIEIEIKDDTNTRIPFEFGRVIIKLHFRKVI